MFNLKFQRVKVNSKTAHGGFFKLLFTGFFETSATVTATAISPAAQEVKRIKP
jgi:hypothetical protein